MMTTLNCQNRQDIFIKETKSRRAHSQAAPYGKISLMWPHHMRKLFTYYSDLLAVDDIYAGRKIVGIG